MSNSEEAQSTQNNKVIVVRRIIKYDVPDDKNYSDTVQELRFMPNMSGNIYPVDGTSFEKIRVNDITHVDGMQPDIEVIPQKDNIQPTDQDEIIVVHFTPIENKKKIDLDESDNNNENLKKEEKDDPVNKILSLMNQNFKKEKSKPIKNISDNKTIDPKQINDFSNKQETKISDTKENDQQYKDIEALEQETVPNKIETFLTSLDFPSTQREEYLIARRHRTVHPIPLSQDKAWLRSIPQVCEILSNLQQIGEIDMTPDSYDIWYYRH